MVDSFETVWLVIVSGGPRITENNIMDFSRKLASYSGSTFLIKLIGSYGLNDFSCCIWISFNTIANIHILILGKKC